MITLGSWMISCCMLAQPGDNSARPDARSPRLVPKRTAPAAQYDPQRVDPVDVPDDSRSGRTTYPSDSAERTLEELDPARRERPGMERVGGGPRKLRPPELLAEAIASPADGRIKGRPLALVDVLTRPADRTAQRGAVVAYWRLAIAQGQYHYAIATRDRLRRWAETRGKVSTLAESQLASAEASVDDAEFNVLKAAAELSVLIGLEDGERVPWAIDRPHVGAYDLKYDQLFAGKSAPGRLRLIHRTLPISRRAIDMHGEAVVSALDALDATEEEFRQGTTDYATVATWLDRLSSARRAFLQSVLRYNEDIAEYAFSVAPPEADSKLLAAILIRQPAKSTRPTTPEERGADNPAATDSSAPLPFEATPRTFRDEQPPAEQPLIEDSGFRVPPRPRYLFVQQSIPGNRTGQGRGPAGSRGGGTAHGSPSQGAGPAHGAGQAHAGGQAVDAGPSHGGLYQGLLNANAAVRAAKLAELLHWDRELPADSGEKASLVSALERAPSAAERRAIIGAYWQTSERIARYLVLSERSQTLAALAPHVLALRSQPGGSGAMLRLQAARQTAQAALLDAQIGLLASEFDLTQLAKSPVERPWLRPATAPHGGQFDVAAYAPRGSGKPPAMGAATRVVTLHLELESQALAVVFADEYRAQVSGAGEHQAASIELALEAVERQMHETDHFLRALTQYNLAIADLALASSQAGAPAQRLVEILVPEQRPVVGG